MASAFGRILSLKTPKNYFIQKAVNGRPFTLLDIGSGNHSPSKTVALFPNCSYYGVDLNRDYNYVEADDAALKGFYEMDLTKLDFDAIPDNHFDYINMAHIIEHLHNGDRVLEKLAPKLKAGGHIYIEYPGKRSTKLPSMYGTLNFYDDPTHVRIYSVKELEDVLKANGFTILSSGTRRSWFYIFFMPLLALSFKMKGERVPAPVLWDLLGFAEYVYAKKNG